MRDFAPFGEKSYAKSGILRIILRIESHCLSSDKTKMRKIPTFFHDLHTRARKFNGTRDYSKSKRVGAVYSIYVKVDEERPQVAGSCPGLLLDAPW